MLYFNLITTLLKLQLFIRRTTVVTTGVFTTRLRFNIPGATYWTYGRCDATTAAGSPGTGTYIQKYKYHLVIYANTLR